MSATPLRERTVLIVAAAELLWALFLAYEIHRRIGSDLSWQLQVLNFMQEWAAPAIALVVVGWVVDVAVAQRH